MGMYKARHKAKYNGYWIRTWKNKVSAIALLVLGSVPIFMEHDATAFVLMSCFAVPMFFTKDNWIL